MLLCADADAASVGLAGGLLSLPIVQHRAAGAVGHGAERVIRPFTTRRHDWATNLWPPALLSLGESWHDMHHSTRPAPAMAPIPRRSKFPLPSSASSSAWAGLPACTGPPAPAWSPAAAIRISIQPAPVLQTARR